MNFEDWMLTKDCTYYPTDDTMIIRKLRECWDAAQKYGEVEQQLAERDAQLLKNADILGEAADALDHKDKQIVMMRDALEWIRKYGTSGELAFRVAQGALIDTQDLSKYILCDADPVGRLIGEEEPLYKARKP
jgi:hypothetical protein